MDVVSEQLLEQEQERKRRAALAAEEAAVPTPENTLYEDMPDGLSLQRNRQEPAVEARLMVEEEAGNLSFTDTIGKAWNSGDNALSMIHEDMERRIGTGGADPDWDPDKWLDMQAGRVPVDQQWRFRSTENGVEAEQMLMDMQEHAGDQELLAARGGFSTFVARGLVGLVDVDAPLMLLSGGAGLGLKGGIMGTRAGMMVQGGAAAAATGMGVQSVAYAANPNEDWTSIPAVGLFGLVLGGAAGSLGKRAVIEEFDDITSKGHPVASRVDQAGAETHFDNYGSQARVEAELAAREAEAAPVEAGAAPREPRVFQVGETSPNGGPSVGAYGQQVPAGAAQVGANPTVLDMIQQAEQRSAAMRLQETWDGRWDYVAGKGKVGAGIASTAKYLQDAMGRTAIGADFDRMLTSVSAIAHTAAYDLFASPSGVINNHRSASQLQDLYHRQLNGAFMPTYQDAFAAWAQRHGHGAIKRNLTAAPEQQFGKLLAEELNGRAYDAPGVIRNVDPEVKNAADAWDKAFEMELNIGKGRTGEGAVTGYDLFQHRTGYMPQRWSGAKMQALMNNMGVPKATAKKALIQAVKESYLLNHPGMLPADAEIWAAAAIRRALANDKGLDTNLIGVLQQDGSQFLRDMLIQNGFAANKVDGLIDRLKGASDTRAQPGQTKQRVDVDMRFTASNGITMMDLFDTDMASMATQRFRGTAGKAALARKGIYNASDRKAVIDAILEEQDAKFRPSQATGAADKLDDMVHGDKLLTREFLDDMFSYFGDGPIGGGVSPVYARMRKLTNLALLNGLGLTQLAELGPMIAANGWEAFRKHAGDEFAMRMSKADSPLVQELQHMGLATPDHKLFRDDFTHELEARAGAQGELTRMLDTFLNKGQRVQGYTSLFYFVKQTQQRIAVTAGANKIMQNMAGLSDNLSTARAGDMGFTDDLWAKIKAKVDDGTVTFKDGYLDRLNLDQWDEALAEDFALILNATVHKQVQKAMIGESSVMFHKDGLASLFFHLKSFPMLAMSKQFMRHTRIMDGETAGAFMYSAATAGAVYSAKQAVNGNAGDIGPEDVMKGAFGLSNLTGWIPMWSDPVAAMLGMDNLKFNQYNQGIDSNIMSIPASFTTLNRMMNIPGSVGNIVTGDHDNNDIRALQATPIIGNAYGMTALANALKN